MRVAYFNARSIRNKINELKAYVSTNNFDIIAISETWLDFDRRDYRGELEIEGYNLYNRDRIGRRGGGVIIYCSDRIESMEINLPLNNDIEVLAIKIKTKSDYFNFAVVYRPPHQSAELDHTLYETLKTIVQRGGLIVGDFNCIGLRDIRQQVRETRDLCGFIDDNFLTQHVYEPTRNANILDLVMSTSEGMVNNLVIEENIVNSDHKLITFDLSVRTDYISTKQLVPDFRKARFDGYRSKFRTINWDHLLVTSDANVNFNILKTILNNMGRDFIPLKQRRTNGQSEPKWFNNDIKKLITQRNKAHSLYKRNNNIINRQLFYNLRRQVKVKIKQSKRNFEKSIAADSKNNPKRFYSYVSCKNSIKETVGPLLNDAGEIVANNIHVASILNNYFASVFTEEDESNIPVLHPVRNFTESDKLVTFNIDESEVAHYIDKLNKNKSSGPDGIYSHTIIELKELLLKPLTKIFRDSVNSGKVPLDFKTANVTPIFKKGDKSLASNYRPISLTSIVGKILESLIRDKIVEHLDKHRLINDSQHGFRKNRSCLTNLLQFYNKIFDIYDEYRAVDVIYLDFQKAFDVVPHLRLIRKLKAYGIDGNVAAWIEDWLKNRTQRVVLNGEASELVKVTSGVPQGSVLGPLLFLIYVNDLDAGLNSEIAKFADDTKLGGSALSVESCSTLQGDLNGIFQWSKTWGMKFNVDKCKVLHIGHNNINYQYTIDNRPMKVVFEEKDLGVIVTSDLKSHKQCVEQCKKANRILGFIFRYFEFKSKDIILQLYKSLVRPLLEYAVQFWSPYLLKDVDMLERVQRRATKMIPGMRSITYEERLKQLKLPSLALRRLRGELIETFKILKGFDDVRKEKFFNLNVTSVTRNNGLKLVGKRFNTNVSKNYFTNKVINCWNSLPADVVAADSINSFKNRLDKHLKSKGHL